MTTIETPEALAAGLIGDGPSHTLIAMRLVVADAIRARDEQWLPLLTKAINQWEDAAGYVGDYFREKWDHTPADIAKAREEMAKMGGDK